MLSSALCCVFILYFVVRVFVLQRMREGALWMRTRIHQPHASGARPLLRVMRGVRRVQGRVCCLCVLFCLSVFVLLVSGIFPFVFLLFVFSVFCCVCVSVRVVLVLPGLPFKASIVSPSEDSPPPYVQLWGNALCGPSLGRSWARWVGPVVFAF